MTFEDLEKKLIEFGNSPPTVVNEGKAKALLIKNMLESLHFRTAKLIDDVGKMEDANHVLSDYVSVLAQAINKIGDLITRPRNE